MSAAEQTASMWIDGGGDAVARPAARRHRLLVPVAVVRRASLAGLLAGLTMLPLYWDQSLWVGAGIALTVFVLWHGLYAGYEAPWLIGVIALGACLQFMIAPWAMYALQQDYVGPSMAVEPDQYFAFAGPATLALVAGMYLPLWRRRPSPEGSARIGRLRASADFRRVCSLMLWGGLALRVMVAPFAPPSLRYALYLLSMLSMVGSMCQLLLGTPGWAWRSVLLLLVSAIGSAADLQFLEVLLWAICVAAMIYVRYRPRFWALAAFAIPASLVFLALSAFKLHSRDDLRRQNLTERDRASVTGVTIVSFVRQPSLLVSPQVVAASMNRLNEGWVTSRVLAWVPSAEPFARGETIATAVSASVLPRVLDPNKYVAGGALIVPRFTGLTLINNTSIGLSVPGEMYANFGNGGAIIGTFIYGLLLGRLFLFFVRRAAASPLWLAWIPFVFFGTLSVEPALGEVLNHVSKSLVLMWGITTVIPEWRRLPRRLRRVRVKLGTTGDVQPAVGATGATAA